MATTYTETPDNYCEIEVSIITGIQEIKKVFFCAKSVLFYDACSFQRHSNLADKEKSILVFSPFLQPTSKIHLFFQLSKNIPKEYHRYILR